jgi:hypothetical protein
MINLQTGLADVLEDYEPTSLFGITNQQPLPFISRSTSFIRGSKDSPYPNSDINAQLDRHDNKPMSATFSAINSFASMIPSPPRQITQLITGTVRGIFASPAEDKETIRDSEATFGHPHNALLDAFDGLHFLMTRFKTALAEAHLSTAETQQATKDYLSVLICVQHMEVLSRYEGNRDCMMRHSALHNVIQILLEILSFWERSPSTFPSNSNLIMKIMMCCLATVSHFTDPDGAWKEHCLKMCQYGIQSNGKGSLHSKVLALESTTVAHIVDAISKLLGFYNKYCHDTSNILSKLVMAAINTLGSLLVSQPSLLQIHIASSELLFNVADLLQTPQEIRSGAHADSSMIQLNNHFRIQLLAVLCVFYITCLSNAGRRKLEETQRDLGVSRLLVWVTAAHQLGYMTSNATFIASICSDFGTQGNILIDNLHPSTAKAFNLDLGNQSIGLKPRVEIHLLVNILSNSILHVGSTFKDPIVREQEMSLHIQRLLRLLAPLLKTQQWVNYGAKLENCSARMAVDIQLAVLQFLHQCFGSSLLHPNTSSDTLALVPKQLLLQWIDPFELWDALLKPRPPGEASESDSKSLFLLALDLVVKAGMEKSYPKLGITEKMLEVIWPKTNDMSHYDHLRITASIIMADLLLATCGEDEDLSSSGLAAFRNDNRIEAILEFGMSGEVSEAASEQLQVPLLRLLQVAVSKSIDLANLIAGSKKSTNTIFAYLRNRKIPNTIIDSFIVTLVSKLLVNQFGDEIQVDMQEEDHTAIQISRRISREWVSLYLSNFPENIVDEDTFKFQLRLLKIISDSLHFYPQGSVERAHLRRGLLNNRIFEHLLSVLNVNVIQSNVTSPTIREKNSTESDTLASQTALISSEGYNTLCELVLQTLGYILDGSKLARRRFRDLDGNEEIRRRIFARRKWESWKGLVDSMFGLVLLRWPSFTTPHSLDFIARNPDGFDGLVNVYQNLSSELQLYMLKKLNELASSHELNRVVMAQSGLAKKLLKRIMPVCRSREHLDSCIKVFEVSG